MEIFKKILSIFLVLTAVALASTYAYLRFNNDNTKQETFLDDNQLSDVEDNGFNGENDDSDLEENEETKEEDHEVYESKENIKLKIPDGKRAITIQINELTSLGYNLKKGDVIDVIAIFPEKNIQNEISFKDNVQLILQNIQVLDVNLTNHNLREQNLNTQEYDTATLLVTPTKAEKLIYAKVFGEIRFLLRGEGDDEFVFGTSGISRDSFKK